MELFSSTPDQDKNFYETLAVLYEGLDAQRKEIFLKFMANHLRDSSKDVFRRWRRALGE